MNLATLLEYNAWATNQYIAAFNDQAIDDDRSVKIMNHILGALEGWMQRIKQIEAPRTLVDRSTFQMHADKLHLALEKMQEEIDPAHPVMFEKPGFHYNGTAEEILHHLVNHSTYHRGQLAIRFREIGKVPPTTDIIYWKRIV